MSKPTDNSPFRKLIDSRELLFQLKDQFNDKDAQLKELRKQVAERQEAFDRNKNLKAEVERLERTLAYLIQKRFEIKEMMFAQQYLDHIERELENFREIDRKKKQ